MSVCSRSIKLMNNQTKGQRLATISHKRREKRRQRMLCLCANIVPQLGCVSQDSEALVSQRGKQVPGETRCKLSWDRFEKYDSLSLRYVKQVSGEKKEPSLRKIQVKNPHQRSPHAMKFEDRPHEETERQQAMVPEARLGTLPKTHSSSKRERQNYILLARGRMGTRSCANERAGGKRVCSGIPERGCIWSARHTSTLPRLETMRISRDPTKVVTANGEVQTREEATENVKELNLFVTVILLEETSRRFFLSGSSARNNGYTYHWTSCQKPHLTKKCKRI